MFKIWEWYDTLHDLWKLLVVMALDISIWFAVIVDKLWVKNTALIVILIIFLFRCSYHLAVGVNKVYKDKEGPD